MSNLTPSGVGGGIALSVAAIILLVWIMFGERPK